MRVITLEEHYLTAEVNEIARRRGATPPALFDVGEDRLAAMDAAGIDVQVLSMAAPGVQESDPAISIPAAAKANDQLAGIVAAHPDRYAGFATLPTSDPQASAAELERAVRDLGLKGAMVNGHTRGRFLDDEAYGSLLAAAEGLGVPLYLHPTYPPAVVFGAYYSGLAQPVANVLATAGWGWHAETALHSLRLIVAGIFDRFPGLRVIIGHLGENLPFYLERADRKLGAVCTNLGRSVAEYFLTQFWITTSGFVSVPSLQCALAVVGADRILFSVDYPFDNMLRSREFLELAPLAPADREKIAHRNAERLLGLLPAS